MSSIRICDDSLIKINKSETIILNNKDINIEYDFNNDTYSVLIFCDYDGEININESGVVNNSNVDINYLLLDEYNLKQNTKIDVNANSKLDVTATILGINEKNITFDLYNRESDSTVDIRNNIVCLDSAIFTLDCIGTIVKGAKRSACHQKTNCLTMDNPKKAKVLPVLNIDENDVEASHSLSSGTIDEEILFYMNSRGLNKKEALNLVLKSYLMPNDKFYSRFSDGAAIQEKALRKVDEICSM